MELQNTGIVEFTELLASRAPVPGGGGASALVSAVGIALGDMVGELTVGKKKYADVEAELLSLMEQAQELRVALLACIEKDAQAFEPLSRAYGIPRDDPGRPEIMEACLRDAAAPPLEILKLTCRAIGLLAEFAEKGSALMISDAATGAALCRGALFGAAVNIRVNTRLMRDRAYAEEIDRFVESQLEKYVKLADDVYSDVMRRLS